MPYARMGAIESLRVNTVELTHALLQNRLRCFDQEMVMICHLALVVAYPIEAFADLPEYIKLGFPICIHEANVLAPVAARGNMVHITG